MLAILDAGRILEYIKSDNFEYMSKVKEFEYKLPSKD